MSALRQPDELLREESALYRLERIGVKPGCTSFLATTQPRVLTSLKSRPNGGQSQVIKESSDAPPRVRTIMHSTRQMLHVFAPVGRWLVRHFQHGP
ncbi:MAG: hypothetical protein IOD10_13990 [Rhodocyclaceae bacterium]|nr:hypothetical protein [Rhodocyclaceae bacterium]MCA3118422.1 hypothetical protein [Rhodocyclaceae bacterium]MCA3128000.1 hypothetical protein [Rhodocyclaceae bacterium]MCA3138110.1 hypothetical protein [Rhodocyclaceae bacterium]MCA3857970.1 hypothetical protein [Burkholderia sp.]